MRLVDSHAHLQAPAFASDLDEVLASAVAAGVEHILVPGWNVASSAAAATLASRHSWLDASAGIHPHEAAGVTQEAWASVRELARDPRVVAVGETGLDYDRAFSPPADQRTNLRRHLDLALELGKPAILHCRSRSGERDAQDDLLAELRAAGFGGEPARRAFAGRAPAVLHSFSGPVDYAESALELGLAISISGLAFRTGEGQTAAVAHLVPSRRLLVETDAPYLSPPGAPRRRNAPEWVRITARAVAEWRDEEPEAVGADLVAAYRAVFRWPSD